MPKFFKDPLTRSRFIAAQTIARPLIPEFRADYTLSGLFVRIGFMQEVRKHARQTFKANYHYIGRHILVEASWQQGFAQLTKDDILNHLKNAVDAAGLTRLYEYAKRHADGSFTAAIVIQESHIIFHAYADGRLVIDAYTCGIADPQDIIAMLCQRLPITLHSSQLLARGLHEAQPNTHHWCTNPAKLRLGIREESLSHPLLQHTTPSFDTSPTGWHGIAEFYGCDNLINNSAKRMVAAFEDVCEHLALDDLQIFQHPFQPQGLSVTFVAKGFHMTVHSWPELYYAPVDLYCSKSEAEVMHLLSQLQLALGAQEMTTTLKSRGTQETHDTQKPLLICDAESRSTHHR